MKDMMPESFASFVPPKPEPIYKYSMEGAGKFLNKTVCYFYKNVLHNI